jgi:hypothetical protein
MMSEQKLESAVLGPTTPAWGRYSNRITVHNDETSRCNRIYKCIPHCLTIALFFLHANIKDQVSTFLVPFDLTPISSPHYVFLFAHSAIRLGLEDGKLNVNVRVDP